MFLKPRIRLFRSVWDCRLPDYRRTRVCGFGFSPAEAYEDWLCKFNRYRLFGGKS